MPSRPSTLVALYAHYAALDGLPRRQLTKDDRQSLAFFRAEQAIPAPTSDPPAPSVKAHQWILHLLEVAAFVEREGRWPHENNRASAGSTREEARLARWVRAHRTSVISGRSCSYQVLRPTFIPGYSLRPLDDRWTARLNAYADFTTTNGRAPRERSESVEQQLARWAAKQRFYYWDGRLGPQRTEAINRKRKAGMFWQW